jgi:hypothetical protein
MIELLGRQFSGPNGDASAQIYGRLHVNHAMHGAMQRVPAAVSCSVPIISLKRISGAEVW